LHVAVIGGGCAGLAAAATLAEQNIPVTVFEAARHLGGRARGLEWNGKRLDNGQHILIGAYRDTLRLMRLAGVDESQALLRLPLQLIQHKQFRLQAPSWLPAPLHILHGLLNAEGLSRSERFAALRFMVRMRLANFQLAHDIPLASLLADHQQPEKVTRWLWEPLCLAALNTPLAQASAQVFLNVLRDSFAQRKRDSDLLLPRVDLSALFAEPLARYIESRGGKIRRNTAVRAITCKDDGYAVTTDAVEQRYTHAVLAVPPFRLQKLASGLPQLATALETCTGYDYQPIATVYLQYPAAVCLPYPMLGLSGGLVQWLLDRGELDGQAGLLAIVISAEGPHMALSQEVLAERVSEEIAQAFPAFPAPLWHKVIIEKRATFACVPGMARPAQQTAYANLLLAGDYTAGDYPATIEGAVRSGIACARRILTS
jgi:squalene-associated FAD-dependent desaturase